VPQKYEKLKASFTKRGYSDKKAKELAARTYNSRKKPGDPPLHRGKQKKGYRPS
jgi:hypothetical protein